MKVFLKQFSRHVVIGGIAFLIDYGLLILLTEIFNLYYLESAAISFIVSIIFNYIFSMKLVYTRRKDVPKGVQFVIFVILSAIGLVMNTGLMYLFVDKFEIIYQISKLASAGIVTIYNFFSRKWLLEDKTSRHGRFSPA